MPRPRPPVPVWVTLPCGVQVRVDDRSYPVGVEVRRLGGGREYSRAQKDATTAHVLLVMEGLGYKPEPMAVHDRLWPRKRGSG